MVVIFDHHEELTALLRRVVTSGTGRGADTGTFVAGKTRHLRAPRCGAARMAHPRDRTRRAPLGTTARDLLRARTTSLKAADTLAGACPAETALTALGRMTQMRARLFAVRQATTAIHPALTQFYEALDQGQKVRFAGMH
jgi:hypothetical protein